MRLINVAGAAAALVVAATAFAGARSILSDAIGLPESASVLVSGGGGAVAPNASADAKAPIASVLDTTTVTGIVQLADGSPVADAVIVSARGGKAISGRNGSFLLPIEVPTAAAMIGITAVATIRGVTYTGHKLVSSVVNGGMTDAGPIMLATSGSGSTCDELAWLPTFGQMPGMAPDVRALAVFDDRSGAGPALYAGGAFATAGGAPVNRIARWNGESWSPLETGISGGLGGSEPYVSALAVFDDGLGGGPALYVGGRFTHAGGELANGIAKWDGTEWSSLGGGMGGDFVGVFSLAVFDDRFGGGPGLYVGGWFTMAGGLAANRIAKWDGISWSALGSGVNGTGVYALTVFDDGSVGGPSLIAGGDFGIAGGVSALRVARWNGSTWSALGSGVGGVPSPYVVALTVFDDGGGPALFAGGNFTTAGGSAANRVAKWNGTSWGPLGSGTNNLVRALTVFDDGSGGGPALYAGGNFTMAGGAAANRIAKWSGTSWTPLGSGIGDAFGGSDSIVYALTVFHNGSGGSSALCAGGSFSTAIGVGALHIGIWDGVQWSSFGDGITYHVAALAIFDDGIGEGPELYAGGLLTSAGGVAANQIAKWNGDTWAPLGSGMNGTVRALAVFDDGSDDGPALYAGGEFTTAGGVMVNRIAKWNGMAWAPLGSGMNSSVFAITAFDDGSGNGPELYAGGWFSTAGGVMADRIAKWNGTSWAPVGGGILGSVYSLTVFDDELGGGPALYVGGNFATAGGVGAWCIAKWNGAQWFPLGNGMISSGTIAPEVRALKVFDDGSDGGADLYVGGNFVTIGGVAATSRIAKWNGAQWFPVGGGMGGGQFFGVSALEVFDDGLGVGPALYASGGFTTAGGVAAGGLAKWSGGAWSPLGSGIYGVNALAVFDDGSGGGQALFAGGGFATSPGGDSYLAKWGCEVDAPCAPADLNCDGAVDGNDLAIVLGGWGPCGSQCIADINDDGIVDGNDLAIVLGAWG